MTAKYMNASRACVHFTRDRLLALFRYDPATGALVDLVSGAEIVSVNNHGYRWVWKDGAALLVHRVAWRLMTGEWPTQMVDHIDGNRRNNAWGNLRQTDFSRNAQNMHKAMVTNKVGLLGVSIDSRNRKNPYRASIGVGGGRRVHLGVFQTPEAAHQAYLKAKAKLHPSASLGWRSTSEVNP
jgi:hypothetical protein